MICHPFEQMAAMLDIVAGGVLERHPDLRVAFLESGLGWLEYWLDRLDGHFESMHQHVPWMKRKPSELFREQCFISIESDEAHRLPRLKELGVDGCVFWGADYPHYDCTYPGAVTDLEEHLAPLDPAWPTACAGGRRSGSSGYARETDLMLTAGSASFARYDSCYEPRLAVG